MERDNDRFLREIYLCLTVVLLELNPPSFPLPPTGLSANCATAGGSAENRGTGETKVTVHRSDAKDVRGSHFVALL